MQVSQPEAALRGLGVRAGDRVGIYMPACAEAVIVMLARARIGAVHLVVFTGFAREPSGSGSSWPSATAVF